MDLTSLDLSATEFQHTLETLYDAQMPLVAKFVNLGRVVGGIGALLYIGAKVWAHLARAEPIDVFPLLRPFAIGLCLLLFPQLCSAVRGITLAVSHTTDALRDDQRLELKTLSAAKQAAIERNPAYRDFASDKAMDDKLATMNPLDVSGRVGLHFQRLQFEVGQNFREWMKNLLELSSMAARLFITLLMTLLLSVLSIAGPLAFGIAIFPGFGGGVQKWFGHFIVISLWLPIANIFAMFLGQMQVILLTNDISRLNAGGNLETADIGYMLFLMLSIGSYLFVPKAADMLLATSGANGVASSFMAGVSGVAALSGAASGAAGRAGIAGTAGVMGMGQSVFGTGAHTASRSEQVAHRAGSALRNYINRSRN